MWTRAELKTNAKAALSRFYWMAFAVCLVYQAIAGFIGSGSYLINLTVNFGETGANLPPAVLMGILIAAIALAVVSLAVSFLVMNPLAVGMLRYFMESRNFKSDFSTLFYGFTGGRYWKVVKVMAVMTLKVLLWTMMLFLPGVILLAFLAVSNPILVYNGSFFFMLFLSMLLMIPGFVKSYEYFMIPYLLAENPHLETRRYFQLTKAMTDGEKMNIFVLGLSFIGWELLGLLLCGIGTLFVIPYQMATFAELYALMRAKAFAMGFSGPDELPDFNPPVPPFYGQTSM